MKNYLILFSAIMLSLVSCKSNTNVEQPVSEADAASGQDTVKESAAPQAQDSKYNPADGRTFGVVGPVKEVRLSKALLSTTSTEEQGDPWLESDALEMTFDECGRVTKDGLGGCVYVYDQEGNFIKGFSEKTLMSRDTEGRIVSYINTNVEGQEYSDIDFEHYISKSFEYDDLGRVAKATYSGWEWMTDYTFEYFGGNVYPKVMKYSGPAESLEIEGTVTYEYDKFDQYGNWLERHVTWDEVIRDCGDEGQPEKSQDVYLERRTIIYY